MVVGSSIALRSHPLPACSSCLLLFLIRLSLCLSCSLLLFPNLPFFPCTLCIFYKLRSLLAELIELEGKSVIDGGLEMLKLVHHLLALLLVDLSLLHLLHPLFFWLGSKEFLLEVIGPAHAVLDEGGQHKQGDQALQQSNVTDHLNLSVIESRHPPVREPLIQHPVVHGPGSVILEDVVDCSQLLELFLCLRVLVRMDHHGLLLVLPLDLLSRGIDADVHQLVEGSIDRVNQLKEGNLVRLPRNIPLCRVPGQGCRHHYQQEQQHAGSSLSCRSESSNKSL